MSGLKSLSMSVVRALGIMLLSMPQSHRGEAAEAIGQRWPASQQISMSQVDHSTFDRLLKKYVDTKGMVNYEAWKASQTDRRALQNYLKLLSRANPRATAPKQARLAFWINAYNAVTLEGIMQVYPTTSIRNHTAKVFGYNIWDDLPLNVGGKNYSLNQIEHEILRKMNEPRIHFAIVCASIGCPKLRNEAYTTEKVDAQLTANAIDFFQQKKHFQIKPTQRTVHLSSILDWFATDFGSTQSEQLHYIAKFAPEASRSFLITPNVTVKYLDYNWGLNHQPSR
ncbi:hypothetical protein Pan241w_51640 [Gimesia alba]|uniref:DUF547 domain-containing protein n=1 Tax=Gimesia alba TaxID=2527973 RepID=A0A517RMD3_9PLAN|nr:DUF547 domain-containing protein [Gimesia alba]QDT45047.1 hypothetical protein Pan241w_51640 [Gimesia alba]